MKIEVKLGHLYLCDVCRASCRPTENVIAFAAAICASMSACEIVDKEQFSNRFHKSSKEKATGKSTSTAVHGVAG